MTTKAPDKLTLGANYPDILFLEPLEPSRELVLREPAAVGTSPKVAVAILHPKPVILVLGVSRN